MNKEVILSLISLLFYVIGFIFCFYNSKKSQEKRDDAGLMIFSSIIGLGIGFLYYWGMGTFNVLNKFDLILIIFCTAISTIHSILSYNGRSLNVIGKVLSLGLNFYVLYLAGGYDSLIKYFNI